MIDLPPEHPPKAQVVVDSLLIHDLRGPTINAIAFNKELAEAAAKLNAILGDPERTVSHEERLALSDILSSDINPCLAYVQKALESMEQRLDHLQYPQER